MTRTGAQRVVDLARETFGEQVEGEVTSRGGRNDTRCYAARLTHTGLGRHVSLSDVDDWPHLKAAWLAATTEEVRS